MSRSPFREARLRNASNPAVAQMGTVTLRLSVDDLALAVCFAVQPRLTDLGPQEAWIQDPELNGRHVSVPHTTLRTCADRLNPRRSLLLGRLLHHRTAGLDEVIAPRRRCERVHERGQVGWRITHKAIIWDVGEDGFLLGLGP